MLGGMVGGTDRGLLENPLPSGGLVDHYDDHGFLSSGVRAE
jgi:hypothetical protein